MTEQRLRMIREIASRMNITQEAAANALQTVTAVLADELGKGQTVKLRGLAEFEVYETPGRSIGNLQTGQADWIGPRKRIRFKPSDKLKEAWNRKP